MATGDHADVPFLQAAKYARGRADGPPLWIVVHTMQEDELGDTAENVANYFAFHTGTRSVSAHYTIDNNSTVQCVRLADTAWTVGNRPGNNRGINYELAGFAEQTRAQWADAYSTSMLRRFAEVARRDMARYDIPARWCTDDDLRARRPGLTTHAQLGEVFGGTTHWDPGTNFPFDGFLSLIGEELDVDEATLRTIIREETAFRNIKPASWMADMFPGIPEAGYDRPRQRCRVLRRHLLRQQGQHHSASRRAISSTTAAASDSPDAT